jgi:hypothetical protein
MMGAPKFKYQPVKARHGSQTYLIFQHQKQDAEMRRHSLRLGCSRTLNDDDDKTIKRNENNGDEMEESEDRTNETANEDTGR